MLSHCFGQDDLAYNKTFQKTFSEGEIKDLQLLYDFFNETICSDSESQNIEDCYNKFFRRMEQTENLEELELNIPFDKQKGIYSQFQDSTFFNIWTFGWIVDRTNSPQDTLKNIHFVYNGKYLLFLKRTGNADKVIKNYYQSIVAFGDLTPVLIGGLVYYYSNYNISDIRVRFIIAMHYLTLNDQFERRENYK